MSNKITIQIHGMTCQSCANRIEKVLNKKTFIETASVNFATEEAQITLKNPSVSTDNILQTIQNIGFQGKLKTLNQPSMLESPKVSWKHWILLLINIPFLIGMLGMLINDHRWMLPAWWQFGLSSIVQLWLALPFYKNALASIKAKSANMDVMVSLGTITIYFYSTIMLIYHNAFGHNDLPHIYFEASVMVIGFVSLGKFLEERTKKQSLNSIVSLVKLTPKQVNVLQNDSWIKMDLSEVPINALIKANQGERIAADGSVEEGSSWCDESHLTGESKPEFKQKNSKVLAGALIMDGSLIYRAEKLGSQTLLGDMMNALSTAQGSKPPIARFADKVAGIFVPTVLTISLLTFIITWWLTGNITISVVHSVAILVIACPCALGLATPAAIMVGMGRAAHAGIWFKDAAAMEESARVNTVVLDKTGTLTSGKPQIVAVWQPQETIYSEQDLYRLAAAVESRANHPLAQAIVSSATEKSLSIPTALSIKSVVGQGIEAEIKNIGKVKVGKPDFCYLSLPTHLDNIWKISSIVAVSVNEQPIGAFALTDTLKADSLQAIKRLQALHMDIIIMSGDQQSVVDYVAKELGILQAYGHLTPRQKADKIVELKQSKKIVAMVGDGVNDTPALATANVSFAMKNGDDIAQNIASATLMQHSVNQVIDALLISRATLKNIKQNFFFAFIYNLLGIPFAALGLLNPVIAGAAMAMSSISVLMNALRLKKSKIH
ncbi:heavy metal translocating P-type ATPase [Rodentibacter caecimuris]|uniref:Copper-translocating P-type ATPase n=1 Tax=Rodentibacter caecimuris TaxID=1796644 RepID=A0ABX3KZA3_9PAST|nr:copper-translocating P-type ATPase [Rodentibacter heylii]